MAIWSRMGLSGPAAAAGAAALIVIIGGAYYVVQRGTVSAPALEEAPQAAAVPDAGTSKPRVEEAAAAETAPASEAEEEPTVTAETSPDDALETGAEVSLEADPASDKVEEAQVEEAASEEVVREEAAEVEAPAPQPPAFDIVQVDPQGGGVIAGTAVPGQKLVFLLDGEEVASGAADGTGKFGVLLDFPVSDAPRTLSIVGELEDGTKVPSDGTVLISPVQIAKAEPEVEPAPELVTEPEPEAVAEAGPESEPEAEVVAEAQAEVETTTEVVEAAPEAPARADAPAVVLADSTGVTVLQPAPQPAVPNAPEGGPKDGAEEGPKDGPVVANVVIDTITYDDVGEVALAGRGSSDGFVRVYLNDQPIKTTRIAQDGAWEAPLPDVDAGVYRLRVDEVDAEGAVTSRIETPFQREAPEVATAAPQAVTAITVQPGFTLWAIARDNFGSGEQYVRVYEANRDLIRDPDLIYPGQVFALPEG